MLGGRFFRRRVGRLPTRHHRSDKRRETLRPHGACRSEEVLLPRQGAPLILADRARSRDAMERRPRDRRRALRVKALHLLEVAWKRLERGGPLKVQL